MVWVGWENRFCVHIHIYGVRLEDLTFHKKLQLFFKIFSALECSKLRQKIFVVVNAAV